MSEAWLRGEEWTLLSRGALDLWRIDVEERDEDWRLLSEDEHRRAERLVVEFKRTQLAASRAALRRILARYTNTPPHALVFEYGEQGKPWLRDHPSLSFNLSHSYEMALVGVTRDTRIGIDVEMLAGDRPLEGMARRFFAAAEVKAWLVLPEAQRLAAFYRTWTRKEAYLKAWGTGLTFSSRLFATCSDRDGRPRLDSTEMPDDEPSRWRLADIDGIAGYQGAVCWEDEVRTLRYWVEEP